MPVEFVDQYEDCCSSVDDEGTWLIGYVRPRETYKEAILGLELEGNDDPDVLLAFRLTGKSVFGGHIKRMDAHTVRRAYSDMASFTLAILLVAAPDISKTIPCLVVLDLTYLP